MTEHRRELAIGGSLLLVAVGGLTAFFGWDLVFPSPPPAPPDNSQILFDMGETDGGAWTWVTTNPEDISVSKAASIDLRLTVSSPTPEGAVVYLHGPIADSAVCYPVRAEHVASTDLPDHVREMLATSYTHPSVQGLLFSHEGYRVMSDEEATALVDEGRTVVVRFLEFISEDSPRSFALAPTTRTYETDYAYTTCTVPADSVWAAETDRRSISFPAQMATAIPTSETNHVQTFRSIEMARPAGLVVPYASKTLDYPNDESISLHEDWAAWDHDRRHTVVLSEASVTFQDARYDDRRRTLAFWVSLGLAVAASLVLSLVKLAYNTVVSNRRVRHG